MPEFRRGWARFLPREAERDLFHPSLEDLRAERRSGFRLQIAIVVLWLDCWRVWLVDPFGPRAGTASCPLAHSGSDRSAFPAPKGLRRHVHAGCSPRAAAVSDGTGIHRRRGVDAGARHRRQHRALRRGRSGVAAAVADRRRRRSRHGPASRCAHRHHEGVPRAGRSPGDARSAAIARGPRAVRRTVEHALQRWRADARRRAWRDAGAAGRAARPARDRPPLRRRRHAPGRAAGGDHQSRSLADPFRIRSEHPRRAASRSAPAGGSWSAWRRADFISRRRRRPT